MSEADVKLKEARKQLAEARGQIEALRARVSELEESEREARMGGLDMLEKMARFAKRRENEQAEKNREQGRRIDELEARLAALVATDQPDDDSEEPTP